MQVAGWEAHMRATDLLRIQLTAVNTLYHGAADDLTDVEWTARAVAGTNVPGFTLWHMPRTQDWAIQTVVRGIPEVIADPHWRGRGALTTPGIGVGMTLDEADALARGVAKDDVVAYADAVHQAILDWLATLDDDALDVVPDMRAHEAPHPEYQLAAMRAEVEDMVGMPVWRFCNGPANGHLRGHLGEIDTLKQILRARSPASQGA